MKKTIKICMECGKAFEASRSNQKFCSKECSKKNWRKAHKEEPKKKKERLYICKCDRCGKEFRAKSRVYYCSEKCKKAAAAARSKTPRKRSTKNTMSELARLEQEARDHGMNYGKYVGMIEQQKGQRNGART